MPAFDYLEYFNTLDSNITWKVVSQGDLDRTVAVKLSENKLGYYQYDISQLKNLQSRKIIRNATNDSTVGNFVLNKVADYGGAIETHTAAIGTVSGNFILNSAGANGGAISGNNVRINNVAGNFIANTAKN